MVSGAKQGRVRIVGAGFSGLTAAYYLERAGWQVEVFEANAGPGGLIHSKQNSFGLVETAANAALNSARLEALAQDVGIEFERPLPSSKNRYIFREKLRRWPLTFLESLGMLGRLLLTVMRQGAIFRARSGESVSDWARRVMGEKARDYFFEPALQGIYGASTQQLSASLILNSFAAARRSPDSVRLEDGRLVARTFRGSTAPKLGMGSFLEALAEKLRSRGIVFHWSRRVSAEELKAWSAEGIPTVLAQDGPAAGALLKSINSEIAARIQSLPRISITTITAFFPVEKKQPRGFGCLFPKREQMQALGVLWNSSIFAGRVKADSEAELVSETWIFSGAEGKTDAEVREAILADRKRVMASAIEPVSLTITRWPHALPAYSLELERWLSGPDREELRGLGILLHGNYLGRIGLSGILDCSADLPARLRDERVGQFTRSLA